MDIIIIAGSIIAIIVGLTIVGLGVAAAVLDKAAETSKQVFDNAPPF